MMNSTLSGRRARQRVLGLTAATLSLAGLGAVGLHRVYAEPAGQDAARRIPLDGDGVAVLQKLEEGFAAIADRIEPSVVSIETVRKMTAGGAPDFERLFRQFGLPDDEQDAPAPAPPGGNANPQQPQQPRRRTFQFPRGGDAAPRQFNARGSGSGVIVRADGWILTNDHVVNGADRVIVTLHDGRKFTGEVRRDYRSDLALVKINASGLQPAVFADSDKVKVGQWAVAFGSPFELNDTMTVGVISARQRQKVISEGGQTRFYPSLLQTDASINPGNSGGALVNSRGEVIGINVAIGSPNGGNVGIGFAIPANIAKDVADQLVSTGKVVRGFLGLTPATLTPENREQYGVRQGGALVQVINEDTPASKAGFQVEDVIVRFNGQAVTDDIQLRTMAARTRPGATVPVVVLRDGRETTLNVTLGEVPEEIAGPAEAPKPKPAEAEKLGATVEAVNEELAGQFKLPKGSAGVVVTAVDPASPAAEAGLGRGDLILRVNGKTAANPKDFLTAMQSVGRGQNARLVVQRGKTRMLVTLTVP